MSNHVHYMIRPAQPEDMPRLMHWLNWYTAMLLNRLLAPSRHFWERRYHAAAVPDRKPAKGRDQADLFDVLKTDFTL